MSDKYRLYIIYSSRGIGSIFNFIKTKTDNIKDIGPMRKNYFRNIERNQYFETAERFVILSSSLYEHLCALGYGKNNLKKEDFEIIPYQIINEDYAHRRSSTMNFYFPIEKGKKNHEKIKEKMEYFTAMGMISKNDWYIHDNNCICEFSRRVNDITKIYIKIIVDCPIDFRVSWCRLNLFSKITPRYSPAPLSPKQS